MTVTETPAAAAEPERRASAEPVPPDLNTIPESTQEYQGPPRAWLAQNAMWRPQMSREEVRSTLAGLWKPTPPELIAKLAKYTGDTRIAPRDRPKQNCAECGSYHAFPCVHLDYLGHSDTTRLVAEADPCWGWYPQAGFDEHGEPKMVRNRDGYPIRLWIWLDILGVVRPGVGTVDTGKTDPEKELIGDAIRNAAQRFGVAADLWSKAKGHEAEVDSSEGHYQQRADKAIGEIPPKAADAPPATPEEWAQRNGWDGEEAMKASGAAVKAELGEFVKAERLTRDQANEAWRTYSCPDPEQPARVLPRTAASHREWYREVIAPLKESHSPKAEPDAAGLAERPSTQTDATTAERPQTASKATEPQPSPETASGPQGSAQAPEKAKREDKADVPDNGFRDELDWLYRHEQRQNGKGLDAVVADLKTTRSNDVALALRDRGADGQGAGDTLRRRLALIIQRRGDTDLASGRFDAEDAAEEDDGNAEDSPEPVPHPSGTLGV